MCENPILPESRYNIFGDLPMLSLWRQIASFVCSADSELNRGASSLLAHPVYALIHNETNFWLEVESSRGIIVIPCDWTKDSSC